MKAITINQSEKIIVIDELDVTQASDWIEIEIGDLRSGDIIDIKGFGAGNYVIIDKTGVIRRKE